MAMAPGSRHSNSADGGDASPASNALESLLVDEGAGAMLGLAIGDTAAVRDGYSTRTQAATVVAYHLMEHGDVDPPSLRASWLESWSSDGGVYADPSDRFVSFMRAGADGVPAQSAVPWAEPAAWVLPLGVWFRDDPDALIGSVMRLVRMSETDAASVVTAVAVAGAVAAGAIAMSGWDLVLASAETAERSLDLLGTGLTRSGTAAAVAEGLRRMSRLVGKPPVAMAQVLDDIDVALHAPLIAIGASADVSTAPPLVIEAVARSYGADGSAVAGGVLGARLGLRRWPWRVPNETWFAEVGRRLVGREREYLDLPIPKVVEERVRSSEPVDPAREID